MIRRALAVTILVVGPLMASAGTASAHPLGNFTINTASAVLVSPERISVTYVVDMAEIPTFQELGSIDVDGDPGASPAELDAWSSHEADRLLRALDLQIEDQPVDLRSVSASATLALGQGGLSVLRLEAAFEAPAPARGSATFTDGNFAGRIGWREMTAAGAGGTAVTRASVPATSPSDTLRSYPDDLLSSPPNVLRARFAFAPGDPAVAPIVASGPTSARAEGDGGALAGLIARGDLTLPAVALALLVAFGLGAVHAIGPGHGKTLMAAYIVGQGGGTRQAAQVGVAVAAMHTASVLALGVVVLVVERLAPERVYPVLTALSGLTALILGGGLAISRLRRLRDGEHQHEHEHEHEHPHGHEHEHPHGHEHEHPRPAPARVLSRRGLFAIAFAGGILPSPSALLALMASFALGRAALGLGLVAVFSLGLATTLSLVVIAIVRARDAVEVRMQGRLTRLLPLASAVAVMAVGLAITVRAISGS